MFTFPQELITEPFIYDLGRKFNFTTNLRRAEVTEKSGWVVLELAGKDNDIENGLGWVRAKGVRVDLMESDVVDG
jgi:hypothetical protein